MSKDSGENAGAAGPKTTLRERISRSRVITTLILTVVAVACMLILTMPEAEKMKYRAGVVPKESVCSTIDFRVVDRKKTEELKTAAEQEIPHYLKLDAAKLTASLTRLDQLKSELRYRIRLEDAGNKYKEEDRASVPNEIVKIVGLLSSDAFSVVRRADKRLDTYFESWKDMLRNGIVPADLNLKPDDKVLIFSDGGSDGSAWARTVPVPLKRLLTHEVAVAIAIDDLYTPTNLSEVVSPKTKDDICKEFKELFGGIILEADLVYDAEKTRAERELASKKTAPCYREIKVGQSLITAGAEITEEEEYVYREHLRQKGGEDRQLWTMIRRLCLILGLMFFICLYIYHIHPEVTRSNGSIWLLSGITVFSLFADWLFAFFAEKWGVPDNLRFMTLPLAMPVLLVSVIYGLRSGIYVGLFSSGIAAIALGNSFPAFISGLLVSGIAGFAVRHTMDYKKFFIRSLLACTLTVFFCGIIFVGSELFREYSTPQGGASSVEETTSGGEKPFHIFEGKSLKPTPEAMKRLRSISKALVALPVVNGLTTAAVTLLALFLLESFFGVASNMSYLPLTDRNNALLRKLQQEAPGTYQHSERVASLAEKAALAIGVDPMKVQACALFHDIGKLQYPSMFIENSNGINPCDGMPPLESAKFLRQHVPHGLELAKKYKLLPLIRHAIQQHHGTDFVSFFYDQAKKSGQPDLKESDFRYPGPLPNEREVVIVALADCTEAAVKSLSDPTPETIRDMVCSLFEKKLHAGQLDDAALSVHDLAQIREEIIQGLIQQTSHNRIPYPDNQKVHSRIAPGMGNSHNHIPYPDNQKEPEEI